MQKYFQFFFLFLLIFTFAQKKPDNTFVKEHYNKKEVYIKISKGTGANSPICVSFHLAERKIEHPFKNKK